MLFYDFYFFYAVGLLLHNGGNPYDLEQYQSALISIGYPLDKVVVPFPYPPWSLYFFYILGSLSFTGSLIALLFVSIVGSLKALLNSLDTVSIKPAWMSPSKALFFSIAFVPLIKGIFFVQLSWIPFISVLAGLRFLSQGRSLLAGSFFSIMLIKPHLWCALYGFLLVEIIRHRRIKLLIGLLLGALLQGGLSYTLFPFDFQFIVTRVFNSPHGAADTQIISSSLFDILAHLCNFSSLRGIGVGLGIFFGAVVALRSEEKDLANTILLRVIPLSLFFAPYAWSHDYILLFPFLMEQIFVLMDKHREEQILRVWVILALMLSGALILNIEVLFVLLLFPVLLRYKSMLIPPLLLQPKVTPHPRPLG